MTHARVKVLDNWATAATPVLNQTGSHTDGLNLWRVSMDEWKSSLEPRLSILEKNIDLMIDGSKASEALQTLVTTFG